MNAIKTISDFASAVKYALSEAFPDCSVESHTATKNNNVKLTGISIRPHGSDISPTVYIDRYFVLFQSGKSFESVLEEIKKDCKESMESTLMYIQPDSVSDFATAKDRICYKLISKELNKELLSEIPHRDFHGLAVTFYLQLGTTENGTATTIITNNLMRIWGKTEEQLFELAETNTQRLHRGRIVPMSIAISRMAGENPTHAYENFDFTKSGKDDFIPMYVATNETCITGASIILYPGLLEAVSEELGSFIVIPSSVHELILVPCTCCDNVSDISGMVREINATEVLETEILSDKCLFYDAESHILKETE